MQFEKMQSACAGVSFCRQINHLDSNPRCRVCEKRRFDSGTERRCSTQAYTGAPVVEGRSDGRWHEEADEIELLPGCAHAAR